MAADQGARRRTRRAGADADYPQESVLSGRTVEELAAGGDRAARGRARELEQARRAARGPCAARTSSSMLAEPAGKPFTRRAGSSSSSTTATACSPSSDDGDVRLLYSRAGIDVTATFPESRAVVAALPFDRFVARRRGRRPRRRARSRASRCCRSAARSTRRAGRRARGARAAGDALRVRPARVRGLRPARAAARRSAKRAAARCCRRSGRCASPSTSSDAGRGAFARRSGWGSRASSASSATSPYGRTHGDWIKVRIAAKSDDFVVVGLHAPGRRRGRASARCTSPYATEAGSSTPAAWAAASRAALDERRGAARGAEPAEPPCRAPIPRGAARWVEPRLVVRGAVQGAARREGLLRQPRVPAAARRQARRGVRLRGHGRRTERPQPETAPASRRRADAGGADRRSPFTNLDKVFWPDEGYTKGDLDRLLPRDLAVAAAVPARSAAGAHALSRRHRRQVVLPEGRAGLRAAGCAPRRSGASTPSARSTTSSATTSSRCSTSRTWARSRCTSGRAASPRSSGPTGASSTSIPRARRSPTS